MFPADLTLIAYAVLATLLGCAMGLVPGLHAFNVAGVAVILAGNNMLPVSHETLALCLLGLVVGYVTTSVVPSIFLFAPDESSAFLALPATKMLLQGNGAEAALFVSAGTLAGFVGLLTLAPFFEDVLRPIRAIIQPHIGWMLVAIIAFLLLGEWPRTSNQSANPWRRLAEAWAYLGAGLLTFVLSGVLGFVLMYRSPIALNDSFQNLMPAFVGLFAVPSLLQAFAFGAPIPKQTGVNAASLNNLKTTDLARGTLTGLAGGLFASFLPVVTGGVGGLLAGHATAQFNPKLFLVSQGASKVAYTVGSVLLLFVPGLTLVRGGLASMLSTLYVPYGTRLFWQAVGVVALCAALSGVVLMALLPLIVRHIHRINMRVIAFVSLIAALLITYAFTHTAGLGVLVVAAMIGLIPTFVGGRRMNCLGIILLPITLNIVGVGATIAGWLGLI